MVSLLPIALQLTRTMIIVLVAMQVAVWADSSCPATEDPNFRVRPQYMVGIITDETRLGDRLLDSWAFAVLATWQNTSAPCTILWQPGYEDLNETITIGQCTVRYLHEFVDSLNFHFDVSAYDYIPNRETTCILDLHQIMGTSHACSGCTDPVSLYRNDRARAILDGIEEFPRQAISIYQEWARKTAIRPGSVYAEYVQLIRSQIKEDGLVGIHVRLTDKIRHTRGALDGGGGMSEEDQKWFTSESESRLMIARAIQFARVHLSKALGRNHFFLAIDDESQFESIASALEENMSDIVVVNRDRSKKSTLGDFFALKECDLILQTTRYTSFSTAAAIAGQARLVSFSTIHNNNLMRWLQVLPINIIEADFDARLRVDYSSTAQRKRRLLHLRSQYENQNNKTASKTDNSSRSISTVAI